MDVSVIVPVYNYGRYLPDALDSVLAQTFGDWECIIVDDASTDDSGRVAAAYAARDARFRVITHDTNKGPAASRNSGIAASRGAYLQFLDADDRLLPDKIAQHVRFLEAHPETGVVYSEAGFFRDGEPDRLMPSLHGTLSRSMMARVHGADEAWRKLEHYNITPTPAALVRRAIAPRFEESCAAHEDWDFWLRCAAAGVRFDFCGDDAPLVAIRAHGRSTSRDRQRMLSGLMAGAKAFPTPERLPLIYEMALGIETVMRGARVDGSRRIAGAAKRATESLTGIRWRIYAIAALLLPRGAFARLVARPMPELPFELYRRLSTPFRKRE